MAKTKARKEKVEQTPAQVVKAAEQFTTEVAVFLPDHLRQLEVTSRDVENARLVVAIEEQSLKNMFLEEQLLLQKIDRQKQILQSKAKQYESMKNSFTALKKDLWPKYGFKEDEALGYDPETGKILK